MCINSKQIFNYISKISDFKKMSKAASDSDEKKDSDYDDSDSDDDRFTIQLNSNAVDVNFSKLCKYSDVIRKRKGIEDAKNFLNQIFIKYESDYGIEERSVLLFLRIIQDESKTKISPTDFWDLNVLSTLFKTKKLSKILQKYAQNHAKDVSFITMIMNRKNSKNFSFFFENIDDSESFEVGFEDILKKNVEGCLQCEEFGKMPISVVTRVISESESEFSSDSLYSFIKKSIEDRYTLLCFIDIKNISGENFDDLYNRYANEKVPKRYYNNIKADIEYVKQLRDKAKVKNNKTDYLLLENRELKEKNKRLLNKKAELLRQLNELHAGNNEIQEENKKLIEKNHENLNSMIDENDKLKEDNQQLENQIDDLRKKIDVILSEIKSQNQKIEKIYDKNYRKINNQTNIAIFLANEVPEINNLKSSGIFFKYFIRICCIWHVKLVMNIWYHFF